MYHDTVGKELRTRSIFKQKIFLWISDSWDPRLRAIKDPRTHSLTSTAYNAPPNLICPSEYTVMPGIQRGSMVRLLSNGRSEDAGCMLYTSSQQHFSNLKLVQASQFVII